MVAEFVLPRLSLAVTVIVFSPVDVIGSKVYSVPLEAVLSDIPVTDILSDEIVEL